MNAFQGDVLREDFMPRSVQLEGYTLRDHFAAQASIGLAQSDPNDPAALARRAYELADAMLKERRRRVRGVRAEVW